MKRKPKDVRLSLFTRSSHANQTNDEMSHTFWTSPHQKATRYSRIPSDECDYGNRRPKYYEENHVVQN